MCLKKIRKKLKWLDPFTYVDIYLMPKLNPNENEAIGWLVYLASAFIFAWLIYTGLGLILGTQSPMMIVVSASMEPVYHRGDIIILHGATAQSLEGPIVELDMPTLQEKELASFANPSYSENQIKAIEFDSGQSLEITKEGSVVVYWSTHLRKPVVHRAVAKLHAADGWYVLTKGDSKQNSTVDQDCGLILNGSPEKDCIEFYPVPIENLQGKAFLHIPIVGCVKLWLLDDLGSLITTGKLPVEFKPGNIC
jgi:signal peptidase I